VSESFDQPRPQVDRLSDDPLGSMRLTPRKDARMDAQQMTEELGQPTAQELLTNAPLARLAYNGQDGLPRVIPIGFFWNGDEIVICTAVTSPKVEALSKRPDVALTIDAGDKPDTARALLVRTYSPHGVRRKSRRNRSVQTGLSAWALGLSCTTRLAWQRGVHRHRPLRPLGLGS
jgi:hypothetical protein